MWQSLQGEAGRGCHRGRGEVCLAQGLDSRKEVRTGGCHSLSGSGIAGEAVGAAPVLEDLIHLQEVEGRSLVGCILLHQSSSVLRLVLQCRRKNSAAWRHAHATCFPASAEPPAWKPLEQDRQLELNVSMLKYRKAKGVNITKPLYSSQRQGPR